MDSRVILEAPPRADLPALLSVPAKAPAGLSAGPRR
jgi:hypothetical protein